MATVSNGGGTTSSADNISTLEFQQGNGGYTGIVDTFLREGSPTKNFATAGKLIVDSFNGGGAMQSLLRFDNIFGDDPGQIPAAATILSASLEMQTINGGDGATLHRMLTPWNDRDSWSSLGNGVQADDSEAVLAYDLATGFVPIGTTLLNVTASLQAWSNGATNYGWAFLPLGSNEWEFQSAQGATSPKLIVEFSTGDGGQNQPPAANDDSAATHTGGAVAIDVLANDTDPDGDALRVVGLTDPSNGAVTLGGDGRITYTSNNDFAGTDQFTYRAWDGGLQSDPATVRITVDAPPAVPLDTSYIATTVGSRTDKRNLEHTNATKSFYHDDQWWSVLPDKEGWHINRFDGPMPEAGSLGGWTVASEAMMSPGRRADIAWHDQTDTLYVLNFGPTENAPRLYKFGYEEATRGFDMLSNVQIAGTGGKITGAEWQRNTEMSLALDQKGNPLVALVGGSANGGEKGLKLAYTTNAGDLSAWATTTVDSGPASDTGGNGDNKADIVAFTHDGIDQVGIAYGDVATDSWKLAYRPTSDAPSDYGSGWEIQTITDAVGVDNHSAALWDGSSIIVTMKDDRDAIWMVKGGPDAWEAPINVHDRSHGASRPTLAYDADNDNVFVFYQEHTTRPYGSIHFKAASANDPVFDAQHPGTRILASSREGENMVDPQMPTHWVGEGTDGKFFVFARNWDAPEVWYNDIMLSDTLLIA